MPIDIAMCFGALSRGRRADEVQRTTRLIPSLAPGTLERCTVGVRTCARSLLLRATLASGPAGEAAAERLAFWSARAGGVARRLGDASAAEVESVELALAASDLLQQDVAPEGLWQALERGFALLWDPDPRARMVAVPMLWLHAEDGRLARVSYDRRARRLFVSSVLAPSVGDEFGLAVDGVTSSGAPVCGAVQVVDVRRKAHGGVSGFFVVTRNDALHRALAHACTQEGRSRRPPRRRMHLEAPASEEVTSSQAWHSR